MVEISRNIEEIEETIESDPYRHNGFFTKMSCEAMKEITERYSTDKMAMDGYLVIDITPEEMASLDMLTGTSLQVFDCTKQKDGSIDECRVAVGEIRNIVKENPNNRVLANTLAEKEALLTELTNKKKTESANDLLERFLFESFFAEEYVFGKIACAIAEQPLLRECSLLDNLDARIKAFKKMMASSVIKPCDRNYYDNLRFFLSDDLRDLKSTQNQKSLTICFTNFQNVGDQEMVNRVINSVVRGSHNRLRTLIFTSEESMFTYRLRDDGSFDGSSVSYCIGPEEDDYIPYAYSSGKGAILKQPVLQNSAIADGN